MQTDYDDEVCFRAVQKIRDLSLRSGERPFFLTVSFTNPHDPWEIRQRYWTSTTSARSPCPPSAPFHAARPTLTVSGCAT